MASQGRRLRRLQERQGQKLFDKIRRETIAQLKKMTPEERAKVEEEHKEFLKQNGVNDGLQL